MTFDKSFRFDYTGNNEVLFEYHSLMTAFRSLFRIISPVPTFILKSFWVTLKYMSSIF